MNLEERKKKEKEYHDKVRSIESIGRSDPEYDFYTSNKKFYCIARSSRSFVDEWLRQRCQGKKVLDYACGDGRSAISAAKNGANVIGIDISAVSIENSRRNAIREGVDKNTFFFVMDAEALEFNDDYFDIIYENGVLHHLDLEKAYSELARVIKPDGEIICTEALRHNPFTHLYRKMTPHLRTKWEAEHILGRAELELAKRYFGKVEVKFFHLATLAAVPFRNSRLFNCMLEILDKVDSVLLGLPLIKWWAWQVVFVLSQPNKSLFE